MFSPEKIRSQTPASIKHAAEMYAKGASSRELAEQPWGSISHWQAKLKAYGFTGHWPIRAKFDFRKALELRRAGLSFGAIGKALKCSDSSVHVALQRRGLVPPPIPGAKPQN